VNGIPDSFRRQSYTGERRVTADLDDCRPIDVTRAVHRLRAAGAHEVEARVSASGNGAHVRAWFREESITPAGVDALRRDVGDHPRRTDMDLTHDAKPQQVLFTSKGDARAGPWRSGSAVWLVADELKRRADHL
jgi:hypothetical protein